jgi:hypothetical protein
MQPSEFDRINNPQGLPANTNRIGQVEDSRLDPTNRAYDANRVNDPLGLDPAYNGRAYEAPTPAQRQAGQVPVIIDGRTVFVQPGVMPFRELVAAGALDKETGSLDVVSTIGGNHSVTIRGGEVFRTSVPREGFHNARRKQGYRYDQRCGYQAGPGDHEFQGHRCSCGATWSGVGNREESDGQFRSPITGEQLRPE